MQISLLFINRDKIAYLHKKVSSAIGALPMNPNGGTVPDPHSCPPHIKTPSAAYVVKYTAQRLINTTEHSLEVAPTALVIFSSRDLEH